MTPTSPSPSRSRRRQGTIVPLLAATLAAGALAVTMASQAEARIVPGKSVAGVTLGDTSAKVRSLLGTPERGSTVLNLRYVGSRGVGIYLIADRVFEIAVVRGSQRTPKGIRIGSTLAALRRAHPAAVCKPAVVGKNAVDCALKAKLAGRGTETLFKTSKGKVTTIAVHFTG